ncbi:MAG: hypothetical protein WCP21_11735, partial [Armatimonadota bacterium]
IVVLSISKPTSVSVNGATIPETAKLATSMGTGWEYSATTNLLHLKPGPGPQVKLEISGMTYQQGSMTVGVVDKLDFGFDQDTEGWRAVCDLAEPTVQGGVLTMGVTGNDPYFVRTNLNLAPDSAKSVLLRLAVSPDTAGLLQVFWTTEDAPGFDEDKTLKLPLIADGQFHDYRIPVGDSPQWQGKRITGLRLDPGSGPTDGSVRIDFVRGAE